jgi:hypothetical protein
MKEEEKKKIEQLMGEIQCPKDFKCVKDNFTCLCKVREFGSDEHLECLEKILHTVPLQFPLLIAISAYAGCEYTLSRS